MQDLLKKILAPIKETQDIRGVAMPIGLEYLQLVVTGPPGAGKSYYINQIRGWPNEGYIDLTRKNWWRDQTLIYRPREVHLGMPWVGHKEAMTVFDKEWLELSPTPPLDFERVRIPPAGGSFLQTNWRDRYIFEFLIPDPGLIYSRRKGRKSQGYFPVDASLTPEMVEQQVLAYQEMAIYMHRAGMNVYIRKGLDKRPMHIAEPGDPTIPRWAVVRKPPRPRLTKLAGWKQLLGLNQGNWFTITDEPQRITGSNRVPHDGKTFDMLLGSHRLCVYPELPLGVKRTALGKHWNISTPQPCTTKKPYGFVRLRVGETIVIGRTNAEYENILELPKEVAKRHVAITNTRGDLTIVPLEDRVGVQLVRSDDLDYRERVGVNRHNAFLAIKEMFGGPIKPLEADLALEQIQLVNQLMDNETNRPLNTMGKPGGLVELENPAVPIIVGDLHAQVDNLLKILSENCLLPCLIHDSATLIVLGDAVHSEKADEMEEMESSMLMMDLIFTLKINFPDNFFYLRGNHDSFDPDISKNGISQGVLMREYLLEARGSEYVQQMAQYYEKLPYIITTPTFFGCHAAPPRSKLTREDLINIHESSSLVKEITRNRLQRPHYLSGYNKGDVKRFRKTLKTPKGIPFIVGHTPLDPFGSVWKNVGTIKNHHIIYSAHDEGPTVFQEINKELVPLSYPAEPLTKLINDLH